VGLGGHSRRGRGAVAEVVNDATKLAPGRLPTKHEAIPAARGRGNLKPYEHRFDLVDTRGTSDYMLPLTSRRRPRRLLQPPPSATELASSSACFTRIWDWREFASR
jgi:hypothetical protein